MSLVLDLGLDHSCPWPQEGISSKSQFFALASNFFRVFGLGLEGCVLDSSSVMNDRHMLMVIFKKAFCFPVLDCNFKITEFFCLLLLYCIFIIIGGSAHFHCDNYFAIGGTCTFLGVSSILMSRKFLQILLH